MSDANEQPGEAPETGAATVQSRWEALLDALPVLVMPVALVLALFFGISAQNAHNTGSRGIYIVLAVLAFLSFFVAAALSEDPFRTGGRGSALTPSPAVEEHIEEVAEALRTSAGSVDERLASLDRDGAEAVRDLVDKTIREAYAIQQRTSRRDQWMFFVLGVVVSIPVQLAITWVS